MAAAVVVMERGNVDDNDVVTTVALAVAVAVAAAAAAAATAAFVNDSLMCTTGCTQVVLFQVLPLLVVLRALGNKHNPDLFCWSSVLWFPEDPQFWMPDFVFIF